MEEEIIKLNQSIKYIAKDIFTNFSLKNWLILRKYVDQVYISKLMKNNKNANMVISIQNDSDILSLYGY